MSADILSKLDSDMYLAGANMRLHQSALAESRIFFSTDFPLCVSPDCVSLLSCAREIPTQIGHLIILEDNYLTQTAEVSY